MPKRKFTLLYHDLHTTIDKLLDEEAGVLFKHYLRYINEIDSELKDRFLQAIFEPIKHEVDRDQEFVEFLYKKKPPKVKSGDREAIIKPKKILFTDSEVFDRVKFKERFPKWPIEKLRHYYDAAIRYSNEGNKYVKWDDAVENWARKDELTKKYKWDEITSNGGPKLSL